MYSKLYYDEHVKPTVEAKIGDRKISQKEQFAITNRLLLETYDKEPELLKKEIQKAIEKDCQEKEAKKALSTSVIAADEALGPKEYLKYVLYRLLYASSLTRYDRAQSSLPDMIGDFLEAIAKCTGWSFTLVGGGPDGAKGSKIRTISLHTGKDAYGQMLPKAIPDYLETVLVPYSKFLESVYHK